MFLTLIWTFVITTQAANCNNQCNTETQVCNTETNVCHPKRLCSPAGKCAPGGTCRDVWHRTGQIHKVCFFNHICTGASSTRPNWIAAGDETDLEYSEEATKTTVKAVCEGILGLILVRRRIGSTLQQLKTKTIPEVAEFSFGAKGINSAQCCYTKMIQNEWQIDPFGDEACNDLKNTGACVFPGNPTILLTLWLILKQKSRELEDALYDATTAPVLVHELSHALCQTDDDLYYNNVKCSIWENGGDDKSHIADPYRVFYIASLHHIEKKPHLCPPFNLVDSRYKK